MRKIVTWIAVIIFTPLICISFIIIVWLFSLSSIFYSSNFDREKWFADEEKRYELYEDIIDSEMLIGKTKPEIRQILGDGSSGIGTDDGDRDWNYYIGYPPISWDIDPITLGIEFKDGKAISVYTFR